MCQVMIDVERPIAEREEKVERIAHEVIDLIKGKRMGIETVLDALLQSFFIELRWRELQLKFREQGRVFPGLLENIKGVFHSRESFLFNRHQRRIPFEQANGPVVNRIGEADNIGLFHGEKATEESVTCARAEADG